jgi:hypothetical protein
MRCQECGRAIRNAEMWRLAGDRNAPSARSMQTLCTSCRQLPARGSISQSADVVLDQAHEIVRQYEAGSWYPQE